MCVGVPFQCGCGGVVSLWWCGIFMVMWYLYCGVVSLWWCGIFMVVWYLYAGVVSSWWCGIFMQSEALQVLQTA